MPNVGFAHNSVCCYNADRITESAQSGTQVCVTRLPQSYWNKPYQKLWMSLKFFLC